MCELILKTLPEIAPTTPLPEIAHVNSPFSHLSCNNAGVLLVVQERYTTARNSTHYTTARNSTREFAIFAFVLQERGSFTGGAREVHHCPK